jgi:hypothetical protein
MESTQPNKARKKHKPNCGAKGGRVMDVRDNVNIDWYYPNIYKEKGPLNYIEIGLMHVRASDNIRIKYDSDRDGWVIEQSSIFEFDVDDNICDEDWQEVSFIKAWGRELNDTTT